MAREASFSCVVCDEPAGRVRLLAGSEPWTDRSRTSLDALWDIDAALRPADQAALVVDTFYASIASPCRPSASTR